MLTLSACSARRCCCVGVFFVAVNLAPPPHRCCLAFVLLFFFGVVQLQYNSKVRLGRGFNMEELKVSGTYFLTREVFFFFTMCPRVDALDLRWFYIL